MKPKAEWDLEAMRSSKAKHAGLAKQKEKKSPPEPKAYFVWTKTVTAVGKC